MREPWTQENEEFLAYSRETFGCVTPFLRKIVATTAAASSGGEVKE